VLSVDFTDKLREYSGMASVQIHFIYSQDEARAWVWQRQAGGVWAGVQVELAGRGARLRSHSRSSSRSLLSSRVSGPAPLIVVHSRPPFPRAKGPRLPLLLREEAC